MYIAPVHGAQHGAHRLGAELLAAERNRLVGEAQGVAHGALRRPAQGQQRRLLEADHLALEQGFQVAGDLLGGQRLEAELQTAGQHRHRQALGIGGGEQELNVRRRLFQGLQQRIEGVRRKHVHLIDQVHLVAAPGGRVLHILEQLAGVLHLGAAGGVHLDQIHEAALADFLAGGADPARAAADPLFAVQTAGQDARDGGLADPAGAGEQIGVVQAVLIQRVGERPGHMLLAHQLVEGARSIFAGENLVTHRSPAKGLSGASGESRMLANLTGLRQREGRDGGRNWRPSRQPHPGTRVHCYRCSLPGLAGFTVCRCGGTSGSAITRFSASAHCGQRPDSLQARLSRTG